MLSVLDRYRPTVDEFLRHVAELRERSRWDESVVLARIDRIAAVEGGFEVGRHGVFRHVLVATGHPGLALPDELAGDPRVVHAYEPHEYAARVAVVGAGMAAATEWLNALAAGSEVVSVRRREPARRPLNVARPFFTQARPRRLLRRAAAAAARSSSAASASRRIRPAGPGTPPSRRPSARAASASPRRSTAPSR